MASPVNMVELLLRTVEPRVMLQNVRDIEACLNSEFETCLLIITPRRVKPPLSIVFVRSNGDDILVD